MTERCVQVTYRKGRARTVRVEGSLRQVFSRRRGCYVFRRRRGRWSVAGARVRIVEGAGLTVLRLSVPSQMHWQYETSAAFRAEKRPSAGCVRPGLRRRGLCLRNIQHAADGVYAIHRDASPRDTRETCLLSFLSGEFRG